MCVVAKHLATLDGHEPSMAVKQGFTEVFFWKKKTGGYYTKPSDVGIILQKKHYKDPY